MFVKNTSITEKLEDHLNTSSDSNGTDESFDELLNEICPPQSLEDIRIKQFRYSNLCRKINTKKKEFEEDKSSSMWKSLYYTFFNSQHMNTITLNELELRCKFLFNMDKYDKHYYPNDNKSKIEPYTNIEKFIKYYLEKKDDNYILNLLKKKITGDNDDIALKQRSSSVDSNAQKKKSRISIKDLGHVEKKRKTGNEVKRHQGTILEMYNIKESNELVETISRIQSEYKKNKDKYMLENLNNILDNKHSFQVEMNNLNMIFNNNSKMKKSIKNFIDMSTYDSFFIANKNVDLIEKYENQLEPQNRLSQKVNLICDKVLSKLDPLYKINI